MKKGDLIRIATEKDLDNKANKSHNHSANDIDETNSKKFITSYEKSKISDIDKKADKLYVDHAINKNIKNKASISEELDTGGVSTEHYAQVNASGNSRASGIRSQVNVCSNSEASGTLTQVNSSNHSTASENNSTVLSSSRVKTKDEYTVVGGYSYTSSQASSKNIKWELNSYAGTVKASGTITGNSSFADFAEYMESENGKAIPVGTIVSMGEGQKIRIAEEGDYPIGIISGTAGIVLNAQGFEWKDRYLYDEYGRPIMTDYYDEELGKTIKVQKLNPEYKPDEEYIPRSERDEWNVVGMKGQIYVNVDKDVGEGDFIQAGDNGIGIKGNKYNRNWLVMEITTPYDKNKGFAIARVII